MAATPKMNVTIHFDAAHRRLIVIVEHTEYQSYSRAVDPRANRAYREWGRKAPIFIREAHVRAEYGWKTLAGRDMSIYEYLLK